MKAYKNIVENGFSQSAFSGNGSNPYFESHFLNSLPNNKILDWSKLKGFADEKINVPQILKFVLGKGRKLCGKRRKCWLPTFSPFPIIFSKGFFLGVVKSWDCVVKSLTH